jgi:hypothetical protein
MSEQQLVERLWAEHSSAPFPSSGYELVSGVDLVGLDAAAAGILQSVAEGAQLMPHQLAALAPVLSELRAVVPVLSGELKPYFTRLLLALQAIEQRTATGRKA